MTVSGVASMCSIKSEFKIKGVWFSLVTFIIGSTFFRVLVWSTLHIDEKSGLYIPIWRIAGALGFWDGLYSKRLSLTIYLRRIE